MIYASGAGKRYKKETDGENWAKDNGKLFVNGVGWRGGGETPRPKYICPASQLARAG